jgi:hypothetical protein
MAGDDEAVAAIVARPARDEHGTRAKAPPQRIRNRTAGILHEVEGRDAGGDGATVGLRHLGRGEKKVPLGVDHVVILRALACFVLSFGTASAAARAVDLALVLAVDVSRSVDDEEYRTQKEGYVDAFRARAVIEAIESGAIGAIAVTYVEWSGDGRQRQLVPWTLLDDAATAIAFAEAIRTTPRAFADFTAVGGAIDFAAGLFANDGFEAARQVIDISGDGMSNAGPAADGARDQALARGIAINALAILNEQWRLDAWYRAHVIGGFGSFVMPARDFVDFRRAIMAKLVREIAAAEPRGNGTAARSATACQP